MKRLFQGIALAFLLALSLRAAFVGSASAAVANSKDVLLSAMQQELQRAQGELGKLDPAPYFMSYAIHDQSLELAVGSQGSVVNSMSTRTRSADVIVRVGSPALDNTHEDNRPSGISSGTIPLADDADAISHVLWQLTYGEYRKASQAYLKVKTATEVNAKEEDTSPDFSQEASQIHGLQRARGSPGPTSAGGDGPALFGVVREVLVRLSFNRDANGRKGSLAFCFH